MTHETLKPCPFCGGEAVAKPGNSTGTAPYVECSFCKTSTAAFTILEGAIAAWDHRTQPESDGLAGELSAAPVRTEIVSVDTGETGRQDVIISLDLRDRILAALSRPDPATLEMAAKAWVKRTGTIECTGEAVPYLKIYFDKVDDMRAFNDAIRALAQGGE